MPPTPSRKPIAVEYILKLEVIMHGFFDNFTLNIPVVLHSMEIYTEAFNEEEAPPPSYDSVVATQ
jgi:hypothetical protein